YSSRIAPRTRLIIDGSFFSSSWCTVRACSLIFCMICCSSAALNSAEQFWPTSRQRSVFILASTRLRGAHTRDRRAAAERSKSLPAGGAQLGLGAGGLTAAGERARGEHVQVRGAAVGAAGERPLGSAAGGGRVLAGQQRLQHQLPRLDGVAHL